MNHKQDSDFFDSTNKSFSCQYGKICFKYHLGEHLCVSAAEIHTFLLNFIGNMPVSDEGEGDDRECGEGDL